MFRHINRRIDKCVVSGLKLRSKMMLLFILLVFIPLIILGFITYSHFSSTVKQSTQQLSTHLIDQINENIDQFAGEMSRLSLMPLYDQEVLSILRRHKNNTQAYPTSQEQLKMRMFISGLTYKRDELKGVHILTNGLYLFSDLDYSVVNLKQSSSIKDKSWYQKVVDADGKAVLIATHRPSYYTTSQDEVFSIARMINDPLTDEKLGVIKIDVEVSFFQNLLENFNVFDDVSISVLDNDSYLIYQYGPELLTMEEQLGGQIYVDVQSKLPENFLEITRSSSNFKIKTLMMIPESVLLKDANSLRSFTMMLLIICIVTAVSLAYLFSYYLLKPINKLKDKMNKAKIGNFEERVSVQTKDEIGELAERFNEMMDQIQYLINQVYETKIREKEAELSALQSQINPHFIYNTLESINMLAVAKKDFYISDMISSLGQLIRYTMTSHDQHVLLVEELRFIDSYFAIQKLRFSDKIKLEMHVSDSCKQKLIPKLLLQPLVENAIVHGLDNGQRKGKIVIEAKRDQQDLLLIVCDNGKGMDQDRLDFVRKKLLIGVNLVCLLDEEKNLALKNIQERIRLLYGEKYGVVISSQPLQETVVTIRIPIKEGTEDV